MKRRILSQQELEQVVKLQQGGASWLKIQQETGIPRRVAKRAYNEWEQSRSLEELKAARRDVATEELRKHLNSLVDFAELLVDRLGIPESPNEMRDADKVFVQLWQTDIYRELEAHRLNRITMPKRQRRIFRQNQMLFKSLQDHTRDEVNWEVLREWREAWDSCIALLVSLQGQTYELVGNFLDQEQGLKEKIEKETGKKDAVRRIADGVLWATWWAATVSRPDEEHASFQTISGGQGGKVIFGPTKRTLQLAFIDEELAQGVARVCNRATKIVYREKIPEQLLERLHTVREKIEELEEMLIPLRLHPLILRTRCDLCPV